MKRALISDIHGNLEALQVVMEDIADQNIHRIICLGDIVGYGPNPVECLDLVMSRCETTILGNHDQATLFDPDGFNPVALQAIYWTREQLELKGTPTQQDLRWEFLGELPRRVDEGELLFVHGSPREPTNEYVFPENVTDIRMMDNLFLRLEKFCFQGHTHMPGVFTESGDFITPERCDYRYKLGPEKAMVNVGSVGQPRDGDSRSCYVILDEEAQSIEFRRVRYPFEVTREKIYAERDLDNMLGDRLRPGR